MCWTKNVKNDPVGINILFIIINITWCQSVIKHYNSVGNQSDQLSASKLSLFSFKKCSPMAKCLQCLRLPPKL